MEIISTLTSAMSQGLIWGIMALGVYITFKILNFSDLTVDGSLALGGSVSAVLISNGIDPFISLTIAALTGAFAGTITGLLHVKLKIPAILSGILTMTALYSINIKLMKKANISLIDKNTIFSALNKLINLKNLDSQTISTLIFGVFIIILVIIILNIFFKTEIGFAIRATGSNKNMIQAQGVNTNTMQIIALALSNGLIALSGAVIAQNQGYADVNMGTGAIVCGLASIIIGEVLFKKHSKILFNLISIAAGSIAYRIIITCVLQFGMNPSDLKLFTSILVAGVLFLPKITNLKGEN